MAESKKPVSRRNFIKYAGAGIVAAAAIGGGYYYSTQKPPTQTPTTTPTVTITPTATTPSGPKGEPVKIAVPAPMSGPYAYYGNELLEGIREGVLDVNAAGGVLGRPVEYLVRDTELTPAVATRRMTELIETEKVAFIVGEIGSQNNFAINEVSKREKIHFMVGNQTETTMHTKDVLSPYTSFPMTVNQTAAYANIATTIEKVGPKHYTLAVDYVWGHEQESMTKEALKVFNGEWVGGESFPLGTTDFSALLKKADEAKPDVLVLIAGGSDQINSLKQVHEFGLEKRMGVCITVTTTAISYAAGGAKTFNGIYAGMDYYYKVANENVPWASKAKALIDRWMTKYGHPPDAYSLGNYVGMMEICAAANRAGSLDSDKVKAELEGHKFEYHKGQEEWRTCDRQATQEWYVVKGLPPEKTTGEYDFFEIVGHTWKPEYLATCQELGY